MICPLEIRDEHGEWILDIYLDRRWVWIERWLDVIWISSSIFYFLVQAETSLSLPLWDYPNFPLKKISVKSPIIKEINQTL